MYDILELNKKLLPDLKEIAKSMNIKRVESLRKQDLVYRILDQQAIDAAEKDAKKVRPKDFDRRDRRQNRPSGDKPTQKQAEPQAKAEEKPADPKPAIQKREQPEGQREHHHPKSIDRNKRKRFTRQRDESEDLSKQKRVPLVKDDSAIVDLDKELLYTDLDSEIPSIDIPKTEEDNITDPTTIIVEAPRTDEEVPADQANDPTRKHQPRDFQHKKGFEKRNGERYEFEGIINEIGRASCRERV